MIDERTRLRRTAEFLSWLVGDCGYRSPKLLPDGRYAAIEKKLFTHAIVVGQIGNRETYEDGWCYPTFDAAKVALGAWDGQGEPTGWTRHPATGRRVSVAPDERDEAGQEVGAAGVAYVRI
jgi:hypothetical protein